MRFDLAQMTRRSRNPRRSQIVLRPIQPTATMAGDLYAAAYRPIIQAWQRGVEAIGARYEAALPVRDSSLQKAQIADSIFDLESILSAIEGELQRLVLSITPGLRDWAVRAEGWHRGKWRGAVLTATGIDLGTLLGSDDVSETVATSISRNVALIRSINDESRARISDIVLRNFQARTPMRQVAKEMAESVGLSRKRALRVAADQSSKLAARLDEARQEQAGITRFKWNWSHKRHGRAIHIAHDGKIYPWNEPPMLDGKPDIPGQLPFCGCRASAVIDLS